MSFYLEEPHFDEPEGDASDGSHSGSEEAEEDGDEEEAENEEGEEDGDGEEGPVDPAQAALTKALWLACSRGADPKRVYHTDVSRGDDHWPELPLLVACEKGHAEIVRWLVSGASPICLSTVTKRENDLSPLHFAALAGRVDILEILLDCDHPATQLISGALHLAAVRGRIDAARFLLERGADPDFYRGGQTPIFNAAFQNHTEMCRFLVQHGADPSAADYDGETPIFHAALNGHLEAIKFFAEETKVNLDHRNNRGFSAFDIANDNLMSEVGLYLWRKGVGSVRKRSQKVLSHRNVYLINGPAFNDYCISLGVVGSQLYILDTFEERLYSGDLAKIDQENLLQFHGNARLPDAAAASRRCLDRGRKGNFIQLDSPWEFQYTSELRGDGNSIQGNWIATPGQLAYYEATILSGGPAPEFGIGYADEDFNLNENFPGWARYSWALHCDMGEMFWADASKMTISLRVGEGNTVGAGIFPNGELFFTRNGRLICTPLIIPHKELKKKLRPTLGICRPDCRIRVNFGSQPFMYDFRADCLRLCPHVFDVPFPQTASLAAGTLCAKQSSFYWIWDSLAYLNLETKSFGSKAIELPADYDRRFSPLCNVESLNACIGDTIWIFVKSKEGVSMKDYWQPFFKIWALDTKTGKAELISVDSSHLRKPLPEELPVDFWLFPVGQKILFSFEPQYSSFFFDTVELRLTEVLPECPPAGIIEKHYVEGTIVSSSSDYEYPLGYVLFSCWQDGDWGNPRYEGDPVAHRTLQAHCIWKDVMIFVGGSLDSQRKALEMSMVTVADRAPESNHHLGFLLSEEAQHFADVSIRCSDGVVVRSFQVVLKARASGFRNLPYNPSQEYRVGFSSKNLRHILEYLYTDAVSRGMTDLEALELAACFDEFAPEHSLRACEYLALSRVCIPSTMSSDMYKAYCDVDSFDVRLQAEKLVYFGHRCILSSRSSFFKAMFLGGLKESTSREIDIPDVSADVFSVVVSHIYLGKSDYTKFADNIVDVLVAASRFGVDDLIQSLESIVSQNVDDANVLSLLSTADACGFRNLLAACHKHLENAK